MARLTKAQKIEVANEEHALEVFREMFAALQDPRRPQGIRYPLHSVVIIALMAMVSSCDSADSIELWGDLNEEWLKTVVDLPHGTPSQDVYLAVFGALDPTALSDVFCSWSAWLMTKLGKEATHIAIDGKTSRRTRDVSNNVPALHTVSAWTSDAGLVLAQCKTDVKSNEITAIPEILRVLDLKSSTITIDAMGCQRDIAETITKRGGGYLLAVKENQPTLYKEIVKTFADVHDERTRALDEEPSTSAEEFTSVDKGHGRVETRTVRLCRDLSWIHSSSRWASLSFVIEITRERFHVVSGKKSVETAYYIGSDSDMSAERAAHLIRQHWGIENSLHWVLDMAFREDEARHRAKNTAQNFTTMRHFALNVIKQDTTRKVGIGLSRKRAGWDKGYLIQLLTGALR